jgi:monoterpene epsilon-lactone hydrolase
MRIQDVLGLAVLAGAAAAATVVRRVGRGPRRPGWPLRTELAQSVMRAVLMRSKRRGLGWLREAQAALPVRIALASEVRFEAARVGGVECEWCIPRERPERTLLYFHGGGYVIGSVAGYRDVIARLAVGAGARVLGVEYRLAPEHPFPAQQEDCLAATRAAVAAGADPARLAFAGDSAGGALAVATLCALRDAGERLPAAAVLLCPWTEPYAEGGSMTANAEFDFGDRELLAGWAKDTGAPPADPRFTVANAKLDGLPPLLVQAGSAEILVDQVRRFAEKARAAGVEVDLQVFPEMFHDFQLQASLLPEGAAALDDAARFLRTRVPAR